MKVLFHLGHPAHFHLLKNVITALKQRENQVYILIKKKDILQNLLEESSLQYTNILPEGRKDDKISIAIGQLIQNIKLFSFCVKETPDILVGTSVSISHIGKLLKIPSLNLNEDDADVVPLYAKLSYPWATHILSPKICRMGKWVSKTIFYDSYHELAYLHPSNFIPDKEIAQLYVPLKKPFYILRFAKLGAHHDSGISGISNKVALQIIEILKPFGEIYITSEKKLVQELDKYRINVRIRDMHHVMAYAKIYIGDSQTMAAEAGVLGIPFIRFNDFVGRISYLDELENKYQLGFGIKTSEKEKLFNTIKQLLNMADLKKIFQKRRHKMLSEKIDYAAFLTWFISDYPSSVDTIKGNPEYQYKFRQ